MVAGLWQRKGKISDCFKNSTSIVFLLLLLLLFRTFGFPNGCGGIHNVLPFLSVLGCFPAIPKLSFQRKGSSIVVRFHYMFLKVGSALLRIENTAKPLKHSAKILIRCWNPFFENLLYFDIAGERQKCCF